MGMRSCSEVAEKSGQTSFALNAARPKRRSRPRTTPASKSQARPSPGSE